MLIGAFSCRTAYIFCHPFTNKQLQMRGDFWEGLFGHFTSYKHKFLTGLIPQILLGCKGENSLYTEAVICLQQMETQPNIHQEMLQHLQALHLYLMDLNYSNQLMFSQVRTIQESMLLLRCISAYSLTIVGSFVVDLYGNFLNLTCNLELSLCICYFFPSLTSAENLFRWLKKH